MMIYNSGQVVGTSLDHVARYWLIPAFWLLHCVRAPIFVQPATHLGVGQPLEVEEEEEEEASVVVGMVIEPWRDFPGIVLLFDSFWLLLYTSQAMVKAAIPKAPAAVGVSLKFRAKARANATTPPIALTASSSVHGTAGG